MNKLLSWFRRKPEPLEAPTEKSPSWRLRRWLMALDNDARWIPIEGGAVSLWVEGPAMGRVTTTGVEWLRTYHVKYFPNEGEGFHETAAARTKWDDITYTERRSTQLSDRKDREHRLQTWEKVWGLHGMSVPVIKD